MKTKLTILFLLFALIGLSAFYYFQRDSQVSITETLTGKRTTADVIALYGDSARSRLITYFRKAGLSYPPKQMTFLGMKDEHTLELWGSNGNEQSRFIRSYDIQKLSGIAGPKLREGDRQVPEGIYKITGLNPNSAYHLSMKLNYPNAFDRLHAKQEGRTEPGTNIFIHGKAVSIGCLAMGDSVIEELFVLAHDTGVDSFTVIIAPYDPRLKKLEYDGETQPAWVKELYQDISREFANY